MFKINKGLIPNTYNVYCYLYINETGFHIFVYSVENIEGPDVVRLLQSRFVNDQGHQLAVKDDDVSWALDIVRLTNCNAVISDDGNLTAVPVKLQKENAHGERSEYREAAEEQIYS